MRVLVALLLVSACSYKPPRIGGDPIDPDAPPMVDAPAPVDCLTDSRECVGDTLRICVAGQMSDDTPCSWSCLGSGATAHCSVLQPVGGGAEADDTQPTGEDVVLTTGDDIDSNGTITNIASNMFVTRTNNGIRVFRFKSLTVSGNITAKGNEPIVLVADGPITIDAVIDARGPCAAISTQTPGPGGRSGGNTNTSATGNGAGAGAGGNGDGGGGGGHGSTGGTGASGQNGGPMFGNDTITTLAGGGGGGGGRTSQGGGGGGAIQLISNTSITINAAGGINAGGCGGDGGDGGSNDAGGGGGAGGMIVFEAPTVTIAGALAVNGGTGGDENSDGNPGSLDRTPATGDGGDGGAGNVLGGTNGGTDAGGGGAVGRIRVNTRSGNTNVMMGAVMSPAFDDTPTTATEGVANIQ